MSDGEVDYGKVALVAKVSKATVERAVLYDGARLRSSATRDAIVNALKACGYKQEAARITAKAKEGAA